MRKKNNKGFTLIELILTVSIIAIVITAVTVSVFDVINSYIANRKLEDDQYNARLALLAITREAHRGFDEVIVTDGKTLVLQNWEDLDGDGIAQDNEIDGVRYEFDGGVLKREDIKVESYDVRENHYVSTIFPVSVELDTENCWFSEFDTEGNPIPETSAENGWLEIIIKCSEANGSQGLRLRTKISTERIANTRPTPSPSPP